MITYNKFIEELPTIATNRVTLDTSLPVSLEIDELNKLYQTFQVSLKQLQVILKEPLDPEELLNIFVNDSTLSNVSASLLNNLIALNYDETKLNTLIELVDSIESTTNKLIECLTNQDTNELYIVYDELRRIVNQFTSVNELLSQIFASIDDVVSDIQLLGQEIVSTNQEITILQENVALLQEEVASLEGGGAYGTEIFSFPEIIDKNISYYSPNNFFPWKNQYNVFIDKFSNKIILHILCVTQADGLFESNINIYNVKSIFDELTQKDSAVIEFQLLFFSVDEAKIPVKYFISKKKIKFYGSADTSNLLFEPNVGVNVYFADNKIRTYGFSLFFNKAGFIKHNALDLSELLAYDEYIAGIRLTQILATESANYEVSKLSDNILLIDYKDEPPHLLNVFSLIDESLIGIDTIFLNLRSYQNVLQFLSDIIFRFKFPFYRVLFDNVTFVFLDGYVEKARIAIPNNLKSSQIVLIFNVGNETLRYIITDEEYYKESIVDFEIDYTKFNDQDAVTLAITEQAQSITLNINLKQPFIPAIGLMPDYIGTSVLPQDSEDTIAFVIDSKVGNLDLAQQIILNLNLGNTEGYFRYVAFFFSPDAMPSQFDYNSSNTVLQIVPLGSNNQITGISNDVSYTSTYVLQFIKKNNKTTLELVSDVCGDVTAFEEMRKNQLQKILQGVSAKLFDTTLYFPLAIASNRSALNFNLRRPNSEYTGSNVSLRVPPRTNEFVWNGYYKIDILSDKYQNLQALSRNYFINQDFHFVDYFVIDSVFQPRISNAATYPFDDKQSKTMLIMVNGLTTIPRDFYFSLNLTFGLRFPETSTFFIRVVNTNYNVKLTDPKPSLQILPDNNYGVQYFSSNNNFVYEKEFTISRINPAVPFDIQTRKFIFALRLSSDLNQCEEIPYEPSLFLTQNDLSNYTTLAEVQALIADIVSGGTIDLSAYATQTDLTNSQNAIENYVNNNFATKNSLTQLSEAIQIELEAINASGQAVEDRLNQIDSNVSAISDDLNNNYYTKTISDGKYALKTDLTPINTNITNIQGSITGIQGSIATLNTGLGNANQSITQINQEIADVNASIENIKPIQREGRSFNHGNPITITLDQYYDHKIDDIDIKNVNSLVQNQTINLAISNPSNSQQSEIYLTCDGDIPQFTLHFLNPSIEKTLIQKGSLGARKYIIRFVFTQDNPDVNQRYSIHINATDFIIPQQIKILTPTETIN